MSPYTGDGESHITKMEVGVMSGAATLTGAAGAVGWIREESELTIRVGQLCVN